MPSGWYGLICCICFEGLSKETCVVDVDGTVWDAHKGECARQAGIVEKGDEGCTETVG